MIDESFRISSVQAARTLLESRRISKNKISLTASKSSIRCRKTKVQQLLTIWLATLQMNRLHKVSAMMAKLKMRYLRDK